MGERLAGRVCLKADRQAGVLRANAAHHEAGADPAETASSLAEELRRMANWLGLSAVEAGPAGNLADALGHTLNHKP